MGLMPAVTLWALPPSTARARSCYPCLGGRVAFSEEALHRAPQILQHMDQVDHDGEVYTSGLGFFLNAVDLMIVAADQSCLTACVVAVAILFP